MNCKYVVIEDEHGFEYPFLFAPMIQHDEFVSKCHVTGKVVGAGFASFGLTCTKNISCFGESVSLNIKSRGEHDEKAFTFMFRRI